MATVNLTAPTDYAIQSQEIERRRRLADMLQQQSLEAPKTEMAGGWAIRQPWTSFAARLGQGLAGTAMHKQATNEQLGLARDLSERRRRLLTEGLSSPDPFKTGAELMSSGDEVLMPVGSHIYSKGLDKQFRDELLRKFGIGTSQATPQQALQMEAATGGAPGPTNAAAQRIAAPNAGLEGVSPLALGLVLSGDAALGKGGELIQGAYKEYNKVENMRPGGTAWSRASGPLFTAPQNGVQIGWNNGQPSAASVPGAATAAAAQTAPVAAAQAAGTAFGRAPYDLSTYQTPGAPTLMTLEQALEQATGRPLPLPFGMNQQPPQPLGAQLPPAQIQNAPSGNNIARLTAPDEKTAQEWSRQISPAPFSIQVAPSQRRPGLPLQDTPEQEAQKHYGTELGKIAGETLKGGDMGRSLQTNAGFMRQALAQIQAAGGNAGRLAPTVQSITEFAQAVGIDPSKLGLPRDAGPYQLMDSITNRMAMAMVGPGGMPANNFSEADRNFLVATMGRKTDTPEGINLKLQTVELMAKRAMEAEQSLLAAQEQGKTFSQWRREWTQHVNSNPLFKTKPDGGAASSPARVPRYNPATRKLE